jgi:hypothetical protein
MECAFSENRTSNFLLVIPACFWRESSVLPPREAGLVFPIPQPQCHAVRGGESLDSRQKHAGMTGRLSRKIRGETSGLTPPFGLILKSVTAG